MSDTRFADVFPEPADRPRYEPPFAAGELTLLTGFLRWQRETLELKCSGLTAEQLARRSVEFSSLSLLGLVRHLADVERFWFRRTMSGFDAPARFSSQNDRDGDFDGAVADEGVVAEAWEAWRSEVAYAERFVADAGSLDVTATSRRGNEISLRWVLLHMVGEYARHNGHADLLRQGVDGAVGQ